MKDAKGSISVLEHVRGDRFPDDMQKEARVNPNQTFRVIFIPEERDNVPPKRKVYSEEVKAIAAEAKRLSDEDKKNGVTREESFAELEQVMRKIGNQLRNENSHKNASSS